MKKTHRIFRDASLVIVFCGGFLALIWFANFLQATPDQETSSEFSQYRIEADEAAQSQDLATSLGNLRSMVAKDPYDGRAQYQLASTLFSQIIETQTADEALSSTESPNGSDEASGQQGSPTASPENLRPATTKERIRPLVDLAIQEYQLAENHARYRLRSQFQLAILWTVKGDSESALDNLEKFVAAGGTTKSGLGQIKQFGTSYRSGPTKLHAHPRFIALIDQETDNRFARDGDRGFDSQRRQQRLFEREPWRQSYAANQYMFPNTMHPSTNAWNLLQRLNYDLIPYRIKLVNFIRVLFK